MKITFNSLGQIVGTIDFEGQTIRQGSTDVVLKAVFQNKQNVNYNAKFNLTRADSANITNVVMNLGSDSNSYVYALNDEWFFAKAGQTTLTVFLVDGSGNQIASGQVQFNVQENDYDEEPETITEEQYNSLLALVNAKASKSQVTLGFSSMPTSTEIQAFGVGQLFIVVNNVRKLYTVKLVSGVKVADEVFDFASFPDFTKQEIQDIIDELEDSLQEQINDNKDDADAHFSDINDKIPSTASSSNKLVDRDTMNSSIAQSASFFRGNFGTKALLLAVAWQTTNPDAPHFVSNNDYAIVEADETHNSETWRYKYVANTGWTAEYKVNNSAFTADQSAAINSGITTEKRVGYDGLEGRKQNKVLYGSDKFDQAQEGDIIVVPTTENNVPLAAGNGIQFQTIDGVTYINKTKSYNRHEVTVNFSVSGSDYIFLELKFTTEALDYDIESIEDLYSVRKFVETSGFISTDASTDACFVKTIEQDKIVLYVVNYSGGLTYFEITDSDVNNIYDDVTEF